MKVFIPAQINCGHIVLTRVPFNNNLSYMANFTNALGEVELIHVYMPVEREIDGLPNITQHSLYFTFNGYPSDISMARFIGYLTDYGNLLYQTSKTINHTYTLEQKRFFQSIIPIYEDYLDKTFCGVTYTDKFGDKHVINSEHFQSLTIFHQPTNPIYSFFAEVYSTEEKYTIEGSELFFNGHLTGLEKITIEPEKWINITLQNEALSKIMDYHS